MTNIKTQSTTENNESRREEKKATDNKGRVSVRLPKRLEKLSEQVDRIRKIDGDESMFRSRFRLPYSSPEPIRPKRKNLN